MEKLELSQLSDGFENEQKIIYTNYQTSIEAIQNIVDILVKAEWIDDVPIQVIDNFEGNLYNRNYRFWRLNIIDNIQMTINNISTIFEENGLLDHVSHEVIPKINLYPPIKVIFDNEYKNLMNNNFISIETTINDFNLALVDTGLTTN